MKWKCADEFLDAFIDRPLAALLVLGLKRTPISPNSVTLVAMLVGMAGAVLLACGELPWAAGFITGSLVLDCADGQLARARGGGTELGRILDGAGDYVVGVSLHIGLLVYLLTHQTPMIGYWSSLGIVAASGLGMALHAMILDYHKNLHMGRAPAQPRQRGPLVRLYNAYVRLQDVIAGVPETTCGTLRAITTFGPTARLWIIAAMAIHPHAVILAVVADVYLLGIMVAVRMSARSVQRIA